MANTFDSITGGTRGMTGRGAWIAVALVLLGGVLLGAVAADAASEAARGSATATYPEQVAAIERGRQRLARLAGDAADATARAAVRDEARALIVRSVRDQLLPAWSGTPWDFNGVATEPGGEGIACGVFVATVLRDAGFRVDRVQLGIQASEHIIQTFVGEDRIRRYRDRPAREVAADVGAWGDGLYAVGLDIHAGLLVVDGDDVLFCDSSYLDPVAVVCRRAASSPSFASRYRVVGKLLDDPMVDRWLAGERFETVGGVGR